MTKVVEMLRQRRGHLEERRRRLLDNLIYFEKSVVETEHEIDSLVDDLLELDEAIQKLS